MASFDDALKNIRRVITRGGHVAWAHRLETSGSVADRKRNVTTGSGRNYFSAHVWKIMIEWKGGKTWRRWRKEGGIWEKGRRNERKGV